MDETRGGERSPARHRDPLHGVTLEMILTRLVERVGWEEMGRRVTIRCFTDNPSVSSSLKFLRRTPWARTEVEQLYLRACVRGTTGRKAGRQAPAMNVTIDGLSLYHEVHGAGAPILLVHGFPLSGALWGPLVPALRDEYRLIVPDLRGHGRSAASPDVTMARYADDLALLLDTIGETRPVVLVGMSMGGYVGFEFYRRHPRRVRAVVLTNTRAEADSPEAAGGRRETAARVRREGSRLVAEQMLPKLFGPQASAELRARWLEIMAATPPAGVAAALEALAGRPDSFATLGAMTCPVLIVAGEDDAITPPADARRMHEAAPASRLAILGGAGHMSVVERPEEWLAALTEFLSDLPRHD